MSFEGRRVLVVGASAGIGRGIATHLVEMGARVAFCGRRKDVLEAAIASAGGGEAVVGDMTDPGGSDALVARALEILGGFDLLVIAASASRLTRLRDTDAEEWATLFATNVTGPSLVIRAARPHLERHAVVGVLSSESVGAPLAGLAHYAASKAAMDEMLRGWRVEDPDLRIATVTVGSTGNTDFSRDFDMALAGELMGEWIARGQTPKRSMTADDLGTAIAEMLATAVEHPNLDCQQLTFRCTGGIYSGDIGKQMKGLAG